MTPWPQRYSEVLGNGCCSTVNLTCWSTLLINPQFPKDLQQMEVYFFTENWAEMIFKLAIRWLQTCLKFNIRCNSLGFELYIAVVFQISFHQLEGSLRGFAGVWDVRDGIVVDSIAMPLSSTDLEMAWQFRSKIGEAIWIANRKFHFKYSIFPSIIYLFYHVYSFFSFRCLVFGASSILTNPCWYLLSWTTGCDPDVWE